MPVWSDTGHPPGPLNYRQIEELIAFIRATNDQTFVSATSTCSTRSSIPSGRGRDVHRLGRPELRAGARRDAVPGLLEGRVRAGVGGAPAASAGASSGRPDAAGRRDGHDRRASIAFTTAERDRPGRQRRSRSTSTTRTPASRTTSRSRTRRGRSCSRPTIFPGVATRDVQVYRRWKPGVLPVRLLGPPEHDRHADRGRVGAPSGMTQQLGPGRWSSPGEARRLFGLLDADGWAWAGVKAFVWLVIIILLLGYIPDRPTT